jgi:CheY-like chemotaxis protein
LERFARRKAASGLCSVIVFDFHIFSEAGHLAESDQDKGVSSDRFVGSSAKSPGAPAPSTPGSGDPPRSPRESFFETLPKFFDAIAALLKIVAVLVVIGLVAIHWDDVFDWVRSLTHFKTGWLEFDREAAQRSLAELDQRQANEGFEKSNPEFAKVAIARAEVVAPAVVGARVLWVDPNPENQSLERNVLRSMGVLVDVARTTKESIARVQEQEYDLVISNLGRPGDDEVVDALSHCEATLFKIPPELTLVPQKNQSDLNLRDVTGNIRQIPGVSRAEMLARAEPDRFYGGANNPAQPARLIFYSGHGTGVVADQCARLVTNRADVLLNEVVSALSEVRWSRLAPKSNEGKTGANSQ